MKTLLLILLFSKTILLTQNPILLSDKWTEIVPQETFSAITGGASINIQIPVSDHRIKSIKKDEDVFDQLDRLFPKNTIDAILTDTKGGASEVYGRTLHFTRDRLTVVVASCLLACSKRSKKSLNLELYREHRNFRILLA